MIALRPWLVMGLALLGPTAFGAGDPLDQRSTDAPQRVYLTSANPSGIACNDRIPVKFYAASGGSGERTPAVILLHALGEREDSMMRRMARFFRARGIAAAIMQLPYHMERLPAGDFPLHHYVGGDIPRIVHAYAQSARDVSTVADWLQTQPTVDSNRLGVVGVSLGAIAAHLAMGQDARLRAGVAILGGGNLAGIYGASLVPRFLNPFTVRRLTDAERALVRTVDPLTYAHANRPRRVLMIQAARDDLVPPSAAKLLHRALGKPPIVWLDTNHYAPALVEDEILATSATFLKWAWEAGASDSTQVPLRLPAIQAPTVKFGLMATEARGCIPYIAFQPVPLGRRPDYMSLGFLDLGLSARSPYVSLGITLNRYLDAGMSVRPGRHRAEPYIGLHLTL